MNCLNPMFTQNSRYPPGYGGDEREASPRDWFLFFGPFQDQIVIIGGFLKRVMDVPLTVSILPERFSKVF